MVNILFSQNIIQATDTSQTPHPDPARQLIIVYFFRGNHISRRKEVISNPHPPMVDCCIENYREFVHILNVLIEFVHKMGTPNFWSNIVCIDVSAKQAINQPAHSGVTNPVDVLQRDDLLQFCLILQWHDCHSWLIEVERACWRMLTDRRRYRCYIVWRSWSWDALLYPVVLKGDSKRLVKQWGICINRRRNQRCQRWHRMSWSSSRT